MGEKKLNTLIENVEKLHTSPLGVERISRNVGIRAEDAMCWCREGIKNAGLSILTGKNWYVYYQGCAITINAKSYTVITAKKIKPEIREIRQSEYDCLNEFLYQAIFLPAYNPAPPRSIINLPRLNVYVKDFGKLSGDLGVVAKQNSRIIGAAWTRIIEGYGHIDDDTPELAVSILPEFRGLGVGTLMIKKLFSLLKKKGYVQTSLSVQKDNPALRFYLRLGYRIVETETSAEQEDYLMLKKL